MGAACKIGNHVREQARRGGDWRVGQAGGQDRRPQERLMGRVGKVCCAETAVGGGAERVIEARRPGKSLGGKLGRQSAGADRRRNLTAADPKIKEFRPET